MDKDRMAGSDTRNCYQALNFFMLRAPSLSVGECERLTFLASDTDAETEQFPLDQLDSKVRIAIAIGSPTLLGRLSSGAILRSSDEMRKLRRYIKRMGWRATPFGAFAGIAFGQWGAHTDIALTGERLGRARMDMEWLTHYVRAMEAVPAIRKSLHWSVAPETVLSAGRVSVSRTRIISNETSVGTPRILLTPMLQTALSIAKEPILYSDLCIELVKKSSSKNPLAVEHFLYTLWQQGVLVSDLMPPLTNVDALTWLLDKLAPIPCALTARHQLSALAEMLDGCSDLSASDYGRRIGSTRAYALNMCPIKHKVDIQVDMTMKVSPGSLTGKVREDISLAAQTLLRLSPMPFGPGYLHDYKIRFLERYGANHEVAVHELIDPDRGLGFSRQWTPSTTMIAPERIALRRETLSLLLCRAIRDQRRTVILDDETLANLALVPHDKLTLPTSLELNVTVVASSTGAIDCGEYSILIGQNVGAPSAGQHFGRFSDMAERSVLDDLARVAKPFDPDGNEIVSELVYLPANLHYANVTRRHPVCMYETPSGVTPAVAPKFVVQLSELAISIRNNEFFVRWTREDKRVRFRSGHMLNPVNAPVIIQFLNDIGRDGVAELSGFDWGELSFSEFLPGIKWGRLVLSLARWRLSKSAVGKSLTKSRFNDFLNDWISRWTIPRHVSLVHGDNLLPLDLQDVTAIEEIRGEVLRSSAGACVLQERCPANHHAWLRSGSGELYHSEIIVPLVLHAKWHKSPSPSSFAWRSAANAGINFPGETWVYAKLYCARADQDDLLTEDIHALVQRIQRAFGNVRWFFVRYADPATHIRLRFEVPRGYAYEHLFRAVADWVKTTASKAILSRVAFDTYDQELHRYGGETGIIKAEAVFFMDSQLVLEMIRTTSSEQREIAAIYTMNCILDAFGLSEINITSWLRKNSHLRQQVGAEYREQGKILRKALQDGAGFTEPMQSLMLGWRDTLLAARQHLDGLAKQHKFQVPLDDVLRSFMHMHLNRVGFDSDMENRLISKLERVRESLLAIGARPLPPAT
jgi:thiopeptide-type bacteriocin biosynthesis protein